MTIIPDPPGTITPELQVLRKQTTYYINQNPVDVDFMRSTKASDGAGGFRTTRAALGVTQTVRVIQADENQGVERRNSDGENVRPTLNMMCEWDANVKTGDQFTWRGDLLEVVYVSDMGYEQMCDVAVR